MVGKIHTNRRLLTLGSILAIAIAVAYLLWKASPEPQQQIDAERGVVDLRAARLDKTTVPLNGEWFFSWSQLASPQTHASGEGVFMPLPGVWNGFKYQDKKLSAHGYGTYQLKMILDTAKTKQSLAFYIPFVHSSYALYLDGEKIAADGIVGTSRAGFSPSSRTLMIPFRLSRDTVLVTMHVANFAYALGGVWQSPRVGSLEVIQAHYDRQLAFDLFIFGGLLIMSFYHIALYFLRRKIRSNLFFGLLCFFLAIKNLFSGAAFFYTIWPGANYEIGLKLIHISIFAASSSIWFFLRELFRKEFPGWAGKLLLGVSMVCIIATLIFPSWIYSELMLGFWILGILMMVLMMRGVYLAVVRQLEGALLILGGTLCFLTTVLHDLAIDFKLIHDVYLNGAGFFIFIFSQALLLAVKFTNSFQKVEHLTLDIMNTNRSYSRFVPSEFLSYLNKRSITEVELGDHLQGEMTVFFSDIRSYTSLSENMSPKINFAFINDYLGRVVQFIEQEGGLVNQYLGDGILALFMQSPEDAVRAAVRIQRDISAVTELGGYQLQSKLENGIGIHSGPLILGMLGTAQRMSTGVISDTVNTASRFEGLTKYFGAQIIISESSLKQLEHPSEFSWRSLGKVQVKGKHDALMIYEILDGLPEEQQQLKKETRPDFEAGLEKYFGKDFAGAIACFQQVLAVHATDQAAKVYLGNAEMFLRDGVDADWKGELRMGIK